MRRYTSLPEEQVHEFGGINEVGDRTAGECQEFATGSLTGVAKGRSRIEVASDKELKFGG